MLKPGGVLRLGLPDLARAIRAWLAGDRGDFLVPDSEAPGAQQVSSSANAT